MTKHEYINYMVSVWGEDYIFDLIDRGYEPIEVTDAQNGEKRWKLVLSTHLTQACPCATLAESRPVVSPVSIGNG